MKAILNKIKDALTEMRDDVLVIYAEKGATPFKKPLLMALPALLIAYAGIYSPSSSNLRERRIESAKLKVISAHYAEYTEVQGQRAELRRRMPLLKDKDEWLGYILTSTSKNHGLTFEALSQQEELNAGPLILVSRGASVTGPYEQVGAWLAEMENSKIFLKITSLQMTKNPGTPTSVQVKIVLSIVLPRDTSQPGGAV